MNTLLLPIGIHLMKGSPVYLAIQLHIGLWLVTWHFALIPQVPGHGSIHFWLTQASFKGHSLLVRHSGLHVGGLPMYPETQEQTACELISLHWLFGPQGDGLHGCVIGGGSKNLCLLSIIELRISGSLVILWHIVKASPLYSAKQVQVGIWFITAHSAFCPQVPGQGSLHLLPIHALFLGHSAFKIHSGLHPIYGSPWYSAKQLQTPLWHWAFGPHLVTLQGSVGMLGSEILPFAISVISEINDSFLRGGG